ncbi:AcrR family transcriptional regulator [Trueperella bonasi]|uniref:AcrR family transcriptional regulator n=1 Tax=Trueperella bonasi TaxID=312286 RepID=A0ABT9NHP5_9ACTO|nr:TetR/AcrR family transcriptional regulator [Trueperella bonasi]MDP9806533.1 AcrR family transcriptional regulator [Trueperella bonasi]
MAAMNSDPRYVRVRSRLTEAALRLVLQKPPDTITVSELAREAGISRTTFYQHGDTPAQFVADVVVDIMQPYLDELVAAIAQASDDYLVRWREIGVRMLGALKENSDVVRRIFLADHQSVVLGHISVRLTQSFEAYVEEFEARLSGEEISKLWKEMAIAQQVYNLMAVIVAWLRTDMSESPEAVVNTYLTLAPPWQLARFEEGGTLSLKRSRAISDIVADSYRRKSEGAGLS